MRVHCHIWLLPIFPSSIARRKMFRTMCNYFQIGTDLLIFYNSYIFNIMLIMFSFWVIIISFGWNLLRKIFLSCVSILMRMYVTSCVRMRVISFPKINSFLFSNYWIIVFMHIWYYLNVFIGFIEYYSFLLIIIYVSIYFIWKGSLF